TAYIVFPDQGTVIAPKTTRHVNPSFAEKWNHMAVYSVSQAFGWGEVTRLNLCTRFRRGDGLASHELIFSAPGDEGCRTKRRRQTAEHSPYSHARTVRTRLLSLSKLASSRWWN